MASTQISTLNRRVALYRQ